MSKTNLANCDIEPIHIPGKIQSHGFLIATNDSYIITFCSENISGFLPLTASALLNHPLTNLEDYLQNSRPDFSLSELIISEISKGALDSLNPYPVEIEGQAFNLIISSLENHILLEFERDDSDLKADPLKIIEHALKQIMTERNFSKLLDIASIQIRKVIGYDRVMIYKFHKDGHGEVVAEDKENDLNSWMGLHFPASDIPKQARELYKVNMTRLIADVNTEPSAIITMQYTDATPLDLTNSVLRAVSPIHIQYLKNMGVVSSFSVSLICNGELWGLAACHKYTPRFINFKEREIAKLLGQILSSAISFRQQDKDFSKSNRLKEVVVSLGKGLIKNENLKKILFDYPITLLDAVDAAGVVFSYEGKFYTKGIVPHQDFLVELTEWLKHKMDDQFYESNRLPAEYPVAGSFADCASGILTCRLSKELNEFIIWFRPEVVQTVTWAGNPEKPMNMDGEGILRLTPRESFKAWYQTVRSTSVQWSSEDIKSALLVREEIVFAINRKSMEVRMLNQKLKVAYDELDTFSYTISHDLKNPLTSIKSYCQLLSREPTLTDRGRDMMERVSKSADKMDNMIGEVLRHSQVGQKKLLPTLLNMEELLKELKDELLTISANDNLQIIIDNPAEIYGDQTMIMQVFSNLIGNAVKYSRKALSPLIYVTCKDMGKSIRYSITDNGIGIKATDNEKIFNLFARSKEAEDYEGNGVGLSIVKKIMERHGGKIWIESGQKIGSTFHVDFKKREYNQDLILPSH